MKISRAVLILTGYAPAAHKLYTESLRFGNSTRSTVDCRFSGAVAEPSASVGFHVVHLQNPVWAPGLAGNLGSGLHTRVM